jgi:hypothetical protein
MNKLFGLLIVFALMLPYYPQAQPKPHVNSTSLSPSSYNFGAVQVSQSSGTSFSVNGHSFTSAEVSIDGQDRASFSASKNGQQINVTFQPGSRGAKIARLKVLIESDGPPYFIFASLQGQGA